jgi:hypothetical protein
VAVAFEACVVPGFMYLISIAVANLAFFISANICHSALQRAGNL